MSTLKVLGWLFYLLSFVPPAYAQVPENPGKVYGEIAGGKDDRIPMISSEYPWTTIGKLLFDETGREGQGASGHCTAGLVDTDIAITNAHCVLDKFGKLKPNIRFLPNFKEGSYRHISYAHLIWSGKPVDIDDWAVLKLKTPLGKRYGALGILERPAETLQGPEWTKKLILAGYSANFMNAQTAGLHLGCSVYDYDSPGWYHDCDTSGGSSGSPIFAYIDNKPYVLALNYAEIPGTGKNLAAPIHGIREPLKTAQEEKNTFSKTTAQLCSNHGKAISAAVAFYDGGWTTAGWYTINPGTCREVELPENYTGKLYAYAASGRGIVWEGDQTSCVGTESFTFTNADQGCRSGRLAKFAKFRVEHGEFNEVIFK